MYKMFIQGYNGSQLWDVTLAVQAILATNLVDEYGLMLKRAHNYIKNTQVDCSLKAYQFFLRNLYNLLIFLISDLKQIRRNTCGDPGLWYRHPSKGGWGFSTADNPWPVSDCAAEALKVTYLNLQHLCYIFPQTILQNI